MRTVDEKSDGTAATVRERPETAEEDTSESGDDESTNTSGQVDALYGKEFAGRYHVGETLGKGGYGRVYRAKEIELERDVALKVLQSERDEYSEKTRKRFIREAKLVAGLQEPHTIKLYDYGEADGYLYLAFEYVDGQTLGEFVSSRGPLKPLTLAKLLEQILDSLHEAHEQGVLHRDIKPGNIMVYEHERRGLEVKVLDFGIGKMLEREDREVTKLTAEGTMMGTPRYMSPEQMRGDELGPPTDLWSVGVVALESLIGERVIKSSRALEVTSQILEPGPEPFRVPPTVDVPPFFRQLIEKLLQKSVSDRYQTTDEVLEDLAELRQRERPRLKDGGTEGREEDADEDSGSHGASEDTGEERDESAANREEMAFADTLERPEQETAKMGVVYAAAGVLLLAVGGLVVWALEDSGASESPKSVQVETVSLDESAGTAPAGTPAVIEETNEQPEVGEKERKRARSTAEKLANRIVAVGTETGRRVGRQKTGEETGGVPSPRSSSQRTARPTESDEHGESEERTEQEKAAKRKPEERESDVGKQAEPSSGADGAKETKAEGKESSESTSRDEGMKIWGVE